MTEPTPDQNLINRNIPKLYLGAALSGFAFFYNAIDTLYYRHFDLSFQQIGLLLSSTLLTALLLEVPTGAFADLHGKKKSMILAGLFNLIAVVFVVLGSTFTPFLFGFVCWGVGRAFSSGASSALLFDTLRGLGRENRLIKHTARMSSLFISIDVISGALAPLLYGLSIRLPFYISLAAALLTVVVQMTLHEVSTPKNKNKTSIKHHLVQMKESLNIAIRSRLFIWLTLFSILIITIGKTFAEMISTPFLIHDLNLSLQQLSVIAILGSLIQSTLVFAAEGLEAKLGGKRAFLLVLLVFPLAMLTFAFSRYVLLTAVLSGLIYASWSMGEVVTETYISRNVPDDKRATILSLNAMLVSAVALIALPLIGSGLDTISLQDALVAIAITAIVCGLILYSRYQAKNTLNSEVQ